MTQVTHDNNTPGGNAPSVRCSDVAPEPLPGSAKQTSVYVIFEWPSSWTHDVLDGGTFGEELTEKLKRHLDSYGASLQLVRHPTREGRDIADHHLYLVFADEGITEVTHIDTPEEILNFDLSGPGRNGIATRPRPLLLVCTHAKRDACCAIKGRPLIVEMEKRYPFATNGDVVWETSHTKGHRFAPSMLLMPWGYSFGRMNVEATEALVNSAMEGDFFLPGNRGRGTLDTQQQVAELAVARELAEAGESVRYGQFEVGPAAEGEHAGQGVVEVRDVALDKAYTVTLEERTVEGVIASCGKEPTTGQVWEAVSVQPQV